MSRMCRETSLWNLIASDFAKRYLNFYNSDLILIIIFHLIIILTSFFVIPPFISNTYLFATIIIYLSIISLLNELSHYFRYSKYLIILTKIVALTQLGSGIAISLDSPYILIFGLLFAISVLAIIIRFKYLV